MRIRLADACCEGWHSLAPGSACPPAAFARSTGAASQSGVAGELPAIAINDPSSRLEQAVRNELVFLFTGGGAPAAPRYRMQLAVAGSVSNLTVEVATGRPTDSTYNLVATVTLVEIATNETIVAETFRTAAAFEQTTQRFANERATLDASQRAARDVAARIRTRVAVALRTR